MKILEAGIYSISIPFTWEITHGMATRSACDSFIVEIASDAGVGYGEALVRDYVTGSLSQAHGEPDRRSAAAAIVRKLLSPIARTELSWLQLRHWLETVEVGHHELPLLCGIEEALLDCACRAEEKDIYGLLGSAPAAHEVVYGGTLPILPLKASGIFVNFFKTSQTPNIRVKLGKDREHADATLGLVRGSFGDAFDIRVDANASWTLEDAHDMLPLLRRYGVSMIEEPFGRGRSENLQFIRDCGKQGFTLAADESAITPADVHALAAEGSFSMINIRLAKNGGILRALAMRRAAREEGLSIQAGCHVGETGILSAAGRASASLMPEALYVDGSYDGYILAGNITRENCTFGHGGKAPVLTGRRLGYDVEKEKLDAYATGREDCLPRL
jgi:L-Ala-D/L-Glu epimerase